LLFMLPFEEGGTRFTGDANGLFAGLDIWRVKRCDGWLPNFLPRVERLPSHFFNIFGVDSVVRESQIER